MSLMVPTDFQFHAPNGWQDLPDRGTHALEVIAWNPEESEKPTLICVHGLTRNAHDFHMIAQALSAEFRVYALSMAGRGGSAWLEDPMQYHYGTYVQDCVSFITRLGVKQVSWLGTSMGGIIGMSIAAAFPEMVQALVLNDVGYVLPAASLERIYAYASVPHIYATRAEAEAYLQEVLQPWGVPQEAWPSMLQHGVMVLPDGQFAPACDPNILHPLKVASDGFTKAPEDIDLREIWEKVSCPVLLLHGTASDVLPAEIANQMATAPHVTLTRFDGIGHAPAIMNEEQVEVVHLWLRSQIYRFC